MFIKIINQFLILYPVLNMNQIMLIQILVKININKILVNIGTSPTPKKDHLNPDIKYTIGLSSAKFCQNGGSISIV